jgi:ribosome-associated toxin RatA of RatAB toxin-antitoxin module
MMRPYEEASVRAFPVATACACLLLGALFGVPASAQAGANVVLSPKVREGKIESAQHPHPQTNVQWGRAVALIDAPIDQVTAAVENYARYKDFLPGCETSRVLSQRGASALVYVQVSVLKGTYKFWAELKIKPRQGTAGTRVIEATMTKGNMERFHAQWEISSFDQNRTLVAFQILVDPDLPVPAGMVSDENQKNARRALKGLRKLIAGQPKP